MIESRDAGTNRFVGTTVVRSLRLVHSRKPKLSAVHLAHFGEPRTWAEILALEPRLRVGQWRAGVVDADEWGLGLLQWLRPATPKERRSRSGRWVLTAAGIAHVNRCLGATMTTHYVPHRTASGSLRRSWEYVAAERRVLVSLDRGAADVTFAVEVCSQERPAFGACPIVRVDEERWRILPSRYVRTWPDGLEELRPLAQPISSSLGHGEAVVLTNTPEAVTAALEAL